jgi:hypothetical protein
MDPTKDMAGGSACIYERSSAIEYALGNSNKQLCSLCNDLLYGVTPIEFMYLQG